MSQHTPAAEWRENGEPDPHESRYDCERHQLTCGQLTDDVLANAAFMGYDQPLNIARVLSGDKNYFTPIALMTAVKDRIRWLSRRNVKLEAQRDEMLAAMKAALSAWDAIYPNIVSKIDSQERIEDIEWTEMQAVRAAIAKAEKSK